MVDVVPLFGGIDDVMSAVVVDELEYFCFGFVNDQHRVEEVVGDVGDEVALFVVLR